MSTASFHRRRQPIHRPVDDWMNRPTIVLVTVCAHQKKPILARPDVASLLREAWTGAAAWRVGRYVILPDHLHLFCAPGAPSLALMRWVTYWKTLTSRRWPRPQEQPVWQRDFWDTQLRRDDSYRDAWQYVVANPVRRGLVTEPDDWPYAGELHVLDWCEAR